MSKISKINEKAWSKNAYEAWKNGLGDPKDVAEDMINSPEYYLRKYLTYLGDVTDKNIINYLGSNGRKAIPLAILGANVTVVDISTENRRYAMEVAKEACVNINYVVSDVMQLNIEEYENKYDIALLEGGILHYFTDIDELFSIIYKSLNNKGKLILNDFHPIRKIFSETSLFSDKFNPSEVTGDYFSEQIVKCNVAYDKFLTEEKRKEISKCSIRLWTMGEIISSIAKAGFIIELMDEGPRFDQYKNIPGEFTIVAKK